MNESRRLYRAADDRWLAGVAAGVARYFDIDPIVVRVLWLISVPLTSGLTALAYLVMVIVVPLEPDGWPAASPWQPGAGPAEAAAFAAGGNPGSSGPDPSAAPGAGSSADPNAAPASPEPGAAPGAPGFVPGPGAAGSYSPWDWRWQRRQERWQRREARWAARRGDNSGPIIFGIVLIVIGGLFAWHEFDPNVDIGAVWPLAVIALGVLLVATSMGWRRGE